MGESVKCLKSVSREERSGSLFRSVSGERGLRSAKGRCDDEGTSMDRNGTRER